MDPQTVVAVCALFTAFIALVICLIANSFYDQ